MSEIKEGGIFSTFKAALHKGLFAIFSTSVLNKILGFIGGVFIVRLISKADYGVYSYANNQLSFFMLLTGLGTSSGILQVCSELKDNRAKSKAVYHYGCTVGLGFNALLAAAVLIYAAFAHFPFEEVGTLLAMMSLLPFTGLITSLQTTFLRSELRNNAFAAASLLGAFVTCVFQILFSYFFRVKGLIAARYLSSVITAVLVALILKPGGECTEKCTLDKETKKDFLKISAISMANNGISELLYLLDIFLIGIIVVNEETIAMYKVATVIPTALNFIPMSIITFIYPYFAQHRDDIKWVKKNYRYTIAATFAIDGFIALVLFIIAPWLITFLYGAEYYDSVLPFRILIVGFAFSGTFRILAGNLLVTQRELKFNTFVAVLSGTLNVIADIALIKYCGSVGAAIATLLVQILSGILNTSRMFYIIKKKSASI